ncbi:MAG: DNA repair protein [Actinomycetota bacterium]|nr:DNA repair protein [Actinomycetota bacterium]
MQFRCPWPKHARARFPPLQPNEPFDSPSERLARCGVDALGAEELLALILQSGQRGQNGLETARRLAREFGSISRLARAAPEELTILSGVTPEQAAALVSAFRLARLGASDSVPSTLRSATDVAAVATRELAGANRERAIVLVCNAANQLQQVVQVSEGSIDRCLLPVREILNAVLRRDGRAFAIAHNHPSGDPTPGAEDVRATDELCLAARLVGLRFLDHVVVAGSAWRTVTEGRRTPG